MDLVWDFMRSLPPLKELTLHVNCEANGWISRAFPEEELEKHLPTLAKLALRINRHNYWPSASPIAIERIIEKCPKLTQLSLWIQPMQAPLEAGKFIDGWDAGIRNLRAKFAESKTLTHVNFIVEPIKNQKRLKIKGTDKDRFRILAQNLMDNFLSQGFAPEEISFTIRRFIVHQGSWNKE